MSKKSRKHDQRLAENLRQINQLLNGRLDDLYPEGLTDRIICPLCWRSYHIDENILTDEHVPAKVARHLFTTRTCNNCNSKAGHKLEAELQRHNNYWDVIRKTPNTSFEALVTMSDLGTYNATVLINENGQSQVAVNRKRNNPAVFNFLRDNSLENTQAFIQPVSGGNDRRAKIAVLKAAYLTLFRCFGYGYLFSSAHPVLKLITKQIGDPDSHILPDFGLTPIPDSLELNLINIMRSATPLIGFLVVFDFGLSPSTTKRTGVILPSAIGNSSLLYPTCKAYVGTEISMKFFKIDQTQLPSYLNEPVLALQLCQIYLGIKDNPDAQS